MHSTTLELQISPIDLYSVLAEHNETAFLLESSEGPEKLARFSFLGFLPKKKISLKNNAINVNGEETDTKTPLASLSNEITRNNAQLPGFLGGAVGYFSFDYVRNLERFENKLSDDVDFPDFEFGIFDDAIIFNHKSNEVKYVYRGENRLGEIRRFVRDASYANACHEIYNKKQRFTKEKYCEKVEKAKEYIRAGEIFQVVLSNRFEIKYSGSLAPFYRKLKATNPSPYMYFLKFGERQIIGSSPENLLRVENREITSYATLAGTRPRGQNAEDDKRLELELLADEKERAEHLMLVDLTRNDVGKVAEAGTVQVPEFMNVHKYSHVQHISSTVTGKLADGKNAFDAFNAIFPAGTVSGAPKVRAVQIIDELEAIKRGPYAGAVGYFSSNGNADFAIGIRTLFSNKNKAFIQAGAGIVYDSVPENEYLETQNKAKALLLAIGDDKYEAAINR